jgi:hypothetical protein
MARLRSNPWVRGITLALLAAMILASILWLSPMQRTADQAKLEEQQTVATRITVAAAAASVVIAAVPDDSTTPIADQIAGVSTFMVITSTAIMLERFLSSVSFTVACGWLIPAACVFLMLWLLPKKEIRLLLQIAIRLVVVALCLLFVIPTSLFIDRQIDAVLNTQEIVDTVIAPTEAAPEEKPAEGEEEEISLWDQATGFFTGVFNSVADVPRQAEELLNRFMSAVAAILLTTCVVPFVSIVILWFVSKWACREILNSLLR